MHTSIIDAFVTFFLLSTTNHLQTITVNGDSLGLYLYDNASIKYFAEFVNMIELVNITRTLLL